MSQENVEIVRQIYGHLARGNFWAIAPLLDPQIAWDWGGGFALLEGTTVYHGPQGVEAATREWLKAWEGARVEAEEFFEAGEQVVAFVQILARPRHGGPEVEMRTASVWTVRDGVATDMKGCTRDEALKAVRLEESAVSQENVEVVRCTLDALDRRDYQRAMCGFHTDAVWHNTGDFPGQRTCVGRQAIVDFWEALLEPFQTEGREIERLVERDDIVVLSLHSVARGRTSGVPLDVRWGAAFRVRDGKISRVDVRGSFEKALEAVGLEE